MSQKQIFLTFDRELLEAVKDRCALREKRSVTAQLRKLFADLPLDRDALDDLGKKLRQSQHEEAAPSDPVNVAVRFPEVEYWDARAKSSLAQMTVKEFSTEILKLWIEGALSQWLNTDRQEKVAGL